MSGDAEKQTQVARLEGRLKVVVMEIVMLMRAADRADAAIGDQADALIASVQLEEMVHVYGVRQLLRLSELPLGTQSQHILNELEAILADDNRTNAGKLASVTQLFLGDRPHLKPARTIHETKGDHEDGTCLES